MAVAMASAVLAFFDGGVAVDVCFDVVGCVCLRLCLRMCLRVPVFILMHKNCEHSPDLRVLRSVEEIPPVKNSQLRKTPPI